MMRDITHHLWLAFFVMLMGCGARVRQDCDDLHSSKYSGVEGLDCSGDAGHADFEEYESACFGTASVAGICQMERIAPGYSPSISGDGRFVAFSSRDPSLVSEDSNKSADVFVYNRKEDSLNRESISSSGEQANGDSDSPHLSADGRYVLFRSSASNLVPGDDNESVDVFQRDLAAGTTKRLVCGGHAGDNYSLIVSADGRTVVFSSRSATLVAGDSNGTEDVFMCDVGTNTVTRVSVGNDNQQASGPSFTPSISGDGTVVAFVSCADDLVAGDDNEGCDTFLRQVAIQLTWRLDDSKNESGSPNSGTSGLSGDGSLVVFDSGSLGLIVYDVDRRTATPVVKSELGPCRLPGTAPSFDQCNPSGIDIGVSSDGSFVVFKAQSLDGTPLPENVREDVFLFNRDAGVLSVLSKGWKGEAADNDSRDPRISTDGRFVVFSSSASNLVEGDTNGVDDIFVVGVPQ